LSSTELEDFTLRTIRLGLWKFYITNTPQRLPELIVRQADNLFCFYLGLQDDIKHLAPAARMSTDAFQKMVSVLTSKAVPGHGTDGRRRAPGSPSLERGFPLKIAPKAELKNA
jgi:hypothetical protein